MRTMVAVVVAAVLVGACGTGLTAQPPAASGSRAELVFTTWTKDAKVTNGPEPGYRPALTGLTSHDVVSASPIIDASGSTWLIAITFTPAGKQLFARLTRDNVAACPGDPNTAPAANCPERHLGVWVDLTQADIDGWEDASRVAAVAKIFDVGCLSQTVSSTECGKFVTDPITLETITGGQTQIAGAFTQRTASDFAAAISGG